LLAVVHEHSSVAANTMLYMLCLNLRNERHNAVYTIHQSQSTGHQFAGRLHTLGCHVLHVKYALPCSSSCFVRHKKRKVYAFQQSKRARAHFRFDSCRARLKQRLEAAQEGVSTEDGSSSVTSGLDEDQALQADIMMRRLVQVSIFIFLSYFIFLFL